MKRILIITSVALILSLHLGCSAQTSIGNQDQHGAGVAVKTEGAKKGVQAKVY